MGALKRRLLEEAPDYTEEPCPWCAGEGITLTDSGPYAVECRCDECRGTGTVIVTKASEWA